MAQLQLGVPLKTREAVVECPADLPVGRYRVVLVVAGRSGESAPVELRLTVVRRRVVPVDPVIVGPVRPLEPVRPVTPVTPVSPLTPTTPVIPVRPRRPT